jgi:short-subunit dehydrogenase
VEDRRHEPWRARFYLIQAVLAGMRRAGGGNIVIIASEWGL